MDIKKINQTIKSTQSKLYICIWNDNEIVEIHTLGSLFADYSDILNEYENDTELAYSGLTWSKIFKVLDNFDIHHHEDNMYIKRIK